MSLTNKKQEIGRQISLTLRLTVVNERPSDVSVNVSFAKNFRPSQEASVSLTFTEKSNRLDQWIRSNLVLILGKTPEKLWRSKIREKKKNEALLDKRSAWKNVETWDVRKETVVENRMSEKTGFDWKFSIGTNTFRPLTSARRLFFFHEYHVALGEKQLVQGNNLSQSDKMDWTKIALKFTSMHSHYQQFCCSYGLRRRTKTPRTGYASESFIWCGGDSLLWSFSHNNLGSRNITGLFLILFRKLS